jgi:hypothetical protein
MVREVWPNTKIQLCWWHLRRTMKERLAKAKLSTTPYNPIRAHLEFSFIDFDWRPEGSLDTNEYEGGFDYHQPVPTSSGPGPNAIFIHIPATQPSTQPIITPPPRDFGPTELTLPNGRIVRLIPPKPSPVDCSDPEPFENDSGRRTFCPSEYREGIYQLVDSHLHAHPLIPGYSAPTQEGIREWAVKQMYQYCKKYELRGKTGIGQVDGSYGLALL